MTGKLIYCCLLLSATVDFRVEGGDPKSAKCRPVQLAPPGNTRQWKLPLARFTTRALPSQIQTGNTFSWEIFSWALQSHTPNWDIVNWHLGRLTNLGAKDLHCVDVGGNFGFFSLHMAAIGCNVQTFEIQPHLVNLESHSFGGSPRASKMEIQNVGLSDNVSVMHFSHAEGIAHLTLDTKASNVEVSVVHGDDCWEDCLSKNRRRGF